MHPTDQGWEAESTQTCDTVIEAVASNRPTRKPPRDSSSDRASSKYELVCLGDVSPKSIDWLWPDRIAIGKLTIIAGDPGLGKSTVTLDIAARVSSGDSWPDSPCAWAEPSSVILLSAEDGLADTIRPRLDAAGADPTRVFALTMIQDSSGGRTHFNLKKDIAQLEQAILEAGDVRLVIIDPLAAYLGGTDDHKNADLRGLLAPLTEMTERLQVAVVLVAHLNKSVGIKSIYRLSGSMAYVAVARMVFLILQDPDQPKRRLMLQIKSNIAAGHAGLAFSIVDRSIRWESDPVELNADKALAVEERVSTRKKPRGRAVEFLTRILSDGPLPATEVFAQATQAGFSPNTVRRAQAELGIKPKQMPSEQGRGWQWSLPADDQANPTHDQLEHLSTWEDQSAYDGEAEHE